MAQGLVTAKALVPKVLALDPKRYKLALDNALDGRAEDIRIDFLVTTQTWKNKVAFNITRTPQGRRIFTTSLIYLFVSGGTKPHEIKPVRAPYLRFFRTGFKAKTRIRYIGSGPGRRADKDFQKRLIVHHPGNKAREFDKVIAEKWRKQWPILLQRAFNAEASRQK